MKSPNRFAWTPIGPVEILNAGYYQTSYVRHWLMEAHGLSITRWARNWAAFHGYATRQICMSNPFFGGAA